MLTCRPERALLTAALGGRGCSQHHPVSPIAHIAAQPHTCRLATPPAAAWAPNGLCMCAGWCQQRTLSMHPPATPGTAAWASDPPRQHRAQGSSTHLRLQEQLHGRPVGLVGVGLAQAAQLGQVAVAHTVRLLGRALRVRSRGSTGNMQTRSASTVGAAGACVQSRAGAAEKQRPAAAARTLLMRRSALAQLLHSTTPNALSQSDRKVREGQRLQPPCASSSRSGGSPSPHVTAAAAAGRCTRACCCGGAGCVPRCAAACCQLLAEAKRGGRASLGSGRKPPCIPGRLGGQRCVPLIDDCVTHCERAQGEPQCEQPSTEHAAGLATHADRRTIGRLYVATQHRGSTDNWALHLTCTPLARWVAAPSGLATQLTCGRTVGCSGVQRLRAIALGAAAAAVAPPSPSPESAASSLGFF